MRNRRIVVAVAVAAALGGLAGASYVGAAQHVEGSAAFLRVNQVGYAATGTKRAYLMSTGDESGATFAVEDANGKTVYSAPVGSDLGAWSAAFRHVFALDFGSVSAPGTYSIVVAGPAAASSPTLAIGGADIYRKALGNALSFYENSRDGRDFIPSALRTAPGHLNDEHAMTYLTPVTDDDGFFEGDLTPLGKRIDASGGWWDAGDYPKFVETTSYTVDMLLSGVRDFPKELGAASPNANFTGETRFGLDFLQRMWDDPTRTLYYQVGIAEGNDNTVGDHDIWRLPQADDAWGGNDPATRYIRNRPVFRAAPPGAPVSPNLAGRLAAAFGLCYQVYRASDPAYANKCLRAGEHVFDLADTAPKGNLLTIIPFDFYGEQEWRDDLELGATELYFAVARGGLPSGLPHSDAQFYLRQAAHWASAYIHGPNDAADTLNLYDVSGQAHFELYRAIGQAGSGLKLDVSQDDLLADLKKQLDGALAQAATDPFQFGFTWNNWDTTTHGTGLSVTASEYDQLTGTNAYADWSGRWLANVLGANAWGVSLIVGDGTAFPHCMQHQVANLVGSLDGSKPILAGAAVEGPNGITAEGVVEGMRLCPPNGFDQYKPFDNGKAIFKDDVQNYPNVEPALDLTATSPLAFARQAEGLY